MIEATFREFRAKLSHYLKKIEEGERVHVNDVILTAYTEKGEEVRTRVHTEKKDTVATDKKEVFEELKGQFDQRQVKSLNRNEKFETFFKK